MAFFLSGNSVIRHAFGQTLGQVRSAAGRLGGYGVFWLKALRQPTIDLTLRTHAGLITRIVETPGLRKASPTAFSPATANDWRGLSLR
jgi:hypothetical protein